MTEQNQHSPKVSVILPAYNAEAFIEESLDSVLRQSFSDFEIIAINDGSTDNTAVILDEYAKRDTRIVPVHQKNIGLVGTLNKGIEIAKGDYIARIDGDDPWMDNKLEEQVKALDANDSLVLIGGGFEIINIDGYYLETIMQPLFDEDIRRSLYLRNTFGHSAVVFRKTAAIKAGLYSDQHGPTEDYDLWIRLSKIGEVANLPRPVYRYRINLEGISQQNSEKQMLYTKKHAESLWSKDIPRVKSVSELRSRAHEYFTAPKVTGMGIILKNQYLADNAQIGIKLIRRRLYFAGFKQIISVCLTGRTGIKMTIHRLKKLDIGSFKQSRDSFEYK